MNTQTPMVTRIQKWGNSLGLRLPKSAAAQAKVSAGSEVDVRVKNGEIVIHPMRKARYRLQDMLAEITPSNLHGEVQTGRPVGKELL